jgi:hypothetical protein
MPFLFRSVAFLVCAFALAATIPSSQGQTILDDPLPDEDIVTKQNASTRKLVGKRRNFSSEEQLQAELSSVPEVGLDRNTATEVRKSFVKPKKPPYVKDDLAETPEVPPADLGLQTLKKLALDRPELAALPWQKADSCQLDYAAATLLQNNATSLHLSLEQLPQQAVRECNLAELRMHIWGGQKRGTWDKPDCLPAITQILQVQPAPVRLLLVEQLAKIPGRAATEALAQRAIYDLSPQVREHATTALKSRPASEFQKVLLQGMSSPWRPVTENAVEALVRLQLKNLRRQLEELLLEPDPTLPYVKVEADEKRFYVKELVRMDHAQNCLLCHPAARSNTDLVRGVVPTPGSKMPSRRFAYYSHFGGDLVQVRADTTTLRQDFSVMHQTGPTDAPIPQRFDYFIRERRATPQEIGLHIERAKGERPGSINFQREAVVFALHELGPTSPPANMRASAAPLAK